MLSERAVGSSSNPTALREGKQMLWSDSWKCNPWAGSFPRARGTFGGTRFRTATIPPLAVVPHGVWDRDGVQTNGGCLRGDGNSWI